MACSCMRFSFLRFGWGSTSPINKIMGPYLYIRSDSIKCNNKLYSNSRSCLFFVCNRIGPIFCKSGAAAMKWPIRAQIIRSILVVTAAWTAVDNFWDGHFINICSFNHVLCSLRGVVSGAVYLGAWDPHKVEAKSLIVALVKNCSEINKLYVESCCLMWSKFQPIKTRRSPQ